MNKKNIDIFISYPRASDTPIYSGQDADTWVKSFYEMLKARFHDNLGEKPTVWIDFVDLQRTGAYENNITTAIRDARLFLVIYSKPYIHSDWCRKEFNLFKDENGTDYEKRVVIIAKLPPEDSDLRTKNDPATNEIRQVYKEIKSINYSPFFTTKDKTHIEIDPVHNGKIYKTKIVELCNDCSTAILSEDTTDVTIEPDPVQAPVEYLEDGKVRVIIAQEIDGN